MKQYLSFLETLDALNIHGFEIHKYLQLGLTPYQKPGTTPLYCPYELHEYGYLFTHGYRDDLSLARMELLVDNEPGLTQYEPGELRPTRLSWKYVNTPQNTTECDKIADILKDAVFKRDEVESFSKIKSTEGENDHENRKKEYTEAIETKTSLPTKESEAEKARQLAKKHNLTPNQAENIRIAILFDDEKFTYPSISEFFLDKKYEDPTEASNKLRHRKKSGRKLRKDYDE